MITIENILQKKRSELIEIIEIIEKEQKRKHEVVGSLRFTEDKKHFSYYHYLKEEKDKYPNGKFITKKNKGLIHLLAQKDYDKKVLLWAKKKFKKA
jgi:hypothetical protein